MLKEGSITLSHEGVIIRYSRSLEKILGYRDEELLGKHVASICPGPIGRNMAEHIEQGKHHSAVTGIKARLLRKDSSEADVYLSVYPLRDRTGNLYSFILTINISKEETTPGMFSEEFQRIFRFSNDAVAVTDKDGAIIDVNQSFLDTYGYKREEVLGKNPRVLRSQHSTKELYEKMWEDILDPAKGYWRGEIINLTKDHREVPVLLSINAIKDSKGEIKNFLGVAFNMTRQKELEKLKKMYVDYIVHDMRGPLTTIMVNSELLQMQLASVIPDKSKKKIDMIFACTQRLNNMTADILDYSRLQGGIGLIFKKEKVNFRKVFREAALPFEGQNRKLSVNAVPYPCEVEDREIEADVDKLQRIIYNLLSNAFKHAAAHVSVEYRINGSGLRMTITDDGKGMSMKDADRIFDAFFQTEEGVRTGGAGLGLSIVKSFVETHGGEVWVEPGQGKGATFGFQVPI